MALGAAPISRGSARNLIQRSDCVARLSRYDGAGCTANNDNGLSDLGSRVIVTLMRRRQGGTVGQACFRQNAMHVVLDRGQGNEQVAGDLLVAQTLGDRCDEDRSPTPDLQIEERAGVVPCGGRIPKNPDSQPGPTNTAPNCRAVGRDRRHPRSRSRRDPRDNPDTAPRFPAGRPSRRRRHRCRRQNPPRIRDRRWPSP